MTRSPRTSSPPWAARSASSASAIAWLPPTGAGQPPAWARTDSIMPSAPVVTEGMRDTAWAATPENSARASSPRSVLHNGVPWISIRCTRRATVTACDGTERLSPSTNSTAGTGHPRTGPPGAATTLRARVRRTCGRARGRPPRRAGPAGVGVRDLRVVSVRRSANPNAWKNGEANANGWIAEQTSWDTRRTRGRAAFGHRRQACSASNTRTVRPARAQVTAAASPLGPLPTTVMSVFR